VGAIAGVAAAPQDLPESDRRADARPVKYQHRAKPFEWMGQVFPSKTAFCRRYGLDMGTVDHRLSMGIRDERLIRRPRQL